MAITDAQQAKQIMMKKGGIPQLVKKGKGKKRPGYRGDDAEAEADINDPTTDTQREHIRRDVEIKVVDIGIGAGSGDL